MSEDDIKSQKGSWGQKWWVILYNLMWVLETKRPILSKIDPLLGALSKSREVKSLWQCGAEGRDGAKALEAQNFLSTWLCEKNLGMENHVAYMISEKNVKLLQLQFL